MQESLALYENIVTSKWFQSVPIFLVFTKLDLLEQQLAEFPLEHSYPEYQGGPKVSAAASFIQNMFLSVTPPRAEPYSVTVTTARLVTTPGQRAFWREARKKFMSGVMSPWDDASDLFAISVFLSDDHLRLTGGSDSPGIRRFFRLATRLPMELQMVLCLRASGSMATVISSAETEEGLRHAASFFA